MKTEQKTEKKNKNSNNNHEKRKINSGMKFLPKIM